MKFLRLLLLALAVAAVILALAAAAALDPVVQTWAARRVLEHHFGRMATVARVEAGFSSVDITDLRIERSGSVLTVPAAHLDLPVVAALWSRQCFIHGLVAGGWTLDLSRMNRLAATTVPAAGRAPAGEPAPDSLAASADAAPPPERAAAGSALANLPGLFGSLFDRLHLPFDFSVDQVELNGDIILPPPPGSPATWVHANLMGGGLGAGREGRFVVRLATTGGPGQPIQSLSLEGELAAEMDTPRTFDRLGLRLNAAAFGPGAPQGVRLIGDFGATRAAEGESYSAVISGETKPILALLFNVPASGGRPEGTWNVNVSDDDVTPFALGHVIPDFEVAGEGRFDCDPDGVALHVVGGLDATVERLGVVRPLLDALGTIRVTGDFDVTRSGPVWRIDRLAAVAQGSRPIFSARSLQPFGIDMTSAELNVARTDLPLFEINLEAVPVAWFRMLFPDAQFGGGPITGELTATALRGRLSVRTTHAVAASGFELGRGGRRWVRGVDVSCGVTADYTEAGWQLAVASATVKSGNRLLASGSGKIGQRRGLRQAIKIEASFRCDVPDLLAQPAFEGWSGASKLRAGVLDARVTASLGAASGVSAAVELSSLSAGNGGPPLPTVSANLRADISRNGRVRFSLPLTIDAEGRRSDLAAVGGAVFSPAGARWAGEIDGGRLVLDDAAPVAAAFLPAFSGGSGGTSADFALNFGQIEAGKVAATAFKGDLRVSAGRATLQSVSAQLQVGGSVSGRVEVAEAASPAGGLVLQGAARLTGFNPARMLRRLNPDQPPALDGVFDLDAQGRGAGLSLAEAAERIAGTCSIESKSGRFRLLSAVIAPKSSGGTLSALFDMFWRRKSSDFANAAEAVVYLGKAISDISYDQLSLTLARDAGGTTELRDFALISPELRLEGGGRVLYRSALPFAAQPLSARFTLSARGRAALALKKLDALGPKADTLGYRPFAVPIVVSGSLDKPDTSELQASLLKLAAGPGGFFNRIFGK